MESAGRRTLMLLTWIGMCCGFFVIFLSSLFAEEFSFAPGLMANFQVIEYI